MEYQQDFLSACRKGDLYRVQQLLGKGLVGVNTTDDDESTALQMAAANGHDAVVRFLLLRGALVDKANIYGWTPLMQAARHGHTAVVACLLENRACVSARSKLGVSSLVFAARSGHLSTVKILLENGAEISGPATEEFTALMVASQYGYDSIVRLLIERGFDISHRAHSNGLNALMVAASNGHKSTAKILVENGACITTTNVCGKTALDIAILRGKRQVRCYLDQAFASMKNSDSDNRESSVFSATRSGDLEKVKWVISQNAAEIDTVCKEDGVTPLILASMLGHLSIVRFLTEKGAQIDRQDKVNGWTALMQAVFRGNNEVASYLIQAGANVNLLSNSGCTAFDLATLSAKSDPDLIRILSQHTIFTSNIAGNPIASHANREVKEGQKWWVRAFRHFRRRKMKKDISAVKTVDTWKQLDHMTPNLLHKPLPVVLSTPTVLTESRQNSTSEESKSPLLLLGSASPCRSAASSNALKQVVPPLLPSSGLDTSNPGRSTMPLGRKLELLNPIQKLTSPSGMQWHPNSSAELVTSVDSRIASKASTFRSKSSGTKGDLYDILKKWSLERHYSLFEEQEVDLEALALFTESDLREMGIDSTVSRERLLQIILQLKARTFPNQLSYY